MKINVAYQLKDQTKPKPALVKQFVGSIYIMMSKLRRHSVSLCLNCRKDFELYFCGYFLSSNVKVGQFKKSCGCSGSFKYNENTAKVILKREAIQRGYKFIDFVDGEFKTLISTKIVLECPTHGEWRSCTATNFLKKRSCPECAKLSRPFKRIDDKVGVLQDVAKSVGYTFKTPLHNKLKNRDKIVVICDKGHEFPISVENFRYGRRCPECRGKNMKTLYINNVECKELGVNLIKVGITKDLTHRVANQNGKNKYKFSLWQAWDFYEVSDCKEAENRVKRVLTKPVEKEFIRNNFPDGHSEIFIDTGWKTCRDILEIIGDYKTYRYIPNKKLNDLLEEMFSDNIVR